MIRHHTKVATLLAVSVLALSACTKGKKSTALDNTFYDEISADVPSFNTLVESDANQQDVLGHVYESLLDRDLETYDIIPSLAKSFEVSKDKMSFTFELNENAKWFDGQPVTSQDVEFSLASIFDPKVNSGPMKAFWGSLDPKIKVIDDHKFTIHAKSIHFNNLSLAGSFPILPKHLLQGDDLNAGKMLGATFGSGPYVLEQWVKGDRIILKRNPSYWGKDLKQNVGGNNFEKYIYKIVREPRVGIEMLKDGFFSVYSFNAERWERDAKDPKIQDKYDTYTFINKAPKGYSFISWNSADELFKDKNVRMALSMLLNRKFMIEKFTFGHALPAIGPIASTSDYAPKDLKPVDYEPAKAVELLTKAGWKADGGALKKSGKKFEFELLFSNPDTEKYLTVYKEDLAKVGITLNLKRVDWTTFTKLLDDRKFQALILGWTASVDPDLEQIWHSDSRKGNGSNFVGYSNPKVDQLIKAAQKEFDKPKRIAMNQEISRLIAADAPYTWFLEQPKNFVAARKGIVRPKNNLNYGLGTIYWAPPASATKATTK